VLAGSSAYPGMRTPHPGQRTRRGGPGTAADPDQWMIRLFGEPMPGGKRFVLEGRLISVALQALRLGTGVVLDYGRSGRDERSAVRWLARSAGAVCQVIYLPVDKDTQLARIAHRQASAPHQTFPMTEADVDQWRAQFQVTDAAELGGSEIPSPPAEWPGWGSGGARKCQRCITTRTGSDGRGRLCWRAWRGPGRRRDGGCPRRWLAPAARPPVPVRAPGRRGRCRRGG
jgi:predicted kinase